MSHQDELGLSTWTLSSILNRTLKGLFDEVMESSGSILGEWFLDALDAELERLVGPWGAGLRDFSQRYEPVALPPLFKCRHSTFQIV